MNRVFLGGTANDSSWREELMPILDQAGIDYFNPIVENWTEDDKQTEINERAICDFCLYPISPKMTGVYSIAEAVDDSNKRPKKVIFLVLKRDGDESFDDDQLSSLRSVGEMISKNGGFYCNKFAEVIEHIKKHETRAVESLEMLFQRKR